MKIVLDTNVLASGIFFSGTPSKIISLWREKRIHFVVSNEIIEEYIRVLNELASEFDEKISIVNIQKLLITNSKIIKSYHIHELNLSDTDDNMFIECALSSKTKIIVTGDKPLLSYNGKYNLRIIKPKVFLDEYFPT